LKPKISVVYLLHTSNGKLVGVYNELRPQYYLDYKSLEIFLRISFKHCTWVDTSLGCNIPKIHLLRTCFSIATEDKWTVCPGNYCLWNV